MDSKVMELRLQQWMPIFEAQAKSGLSKQEWCEQNGIKRTAFFKWQRECRNYLLTKEEHKTTIPATSETSFFEIDIDTKTTIFDSSSNGINTSSLSIECRGCTINISGDVDEANLSKVLGVIAHANL